MTTIHAEIGMRRHASSRHDDRQPLRDQSLARAVVTRRHGRHAMPYGRHVAENARSALRDDAGD
jgi:hypothetical protein